MKTKNSGLHSFFKASAIVIASLGFVGCTTTELSKPVYQSKVSDSSQLVKVSRDSKTYNSDEKKLQDCPITFYVNDIKTGHFFANDRADYYLEPGNYQLTVKNCKGRCSSYDSEITIKASALPPEFVLSIDAKGKPFIIRK